MNNVKKGIFIWAFIFLVFTLAACNNKSNQNSENNPEKYKVKLYFANTKYIETGDESLDRVIAIDKEIEGDKNSIYKNTILALKEKPKDDSYDTLIRDDINILDVYVKNNIAYVNISKENLHGGSLEEIFFIGQIVNTLIDSFKEVESVQFLVEGEKIESLMGHIDASKPFKRE